jgi:hypothetical protein
MIWSKADYLVVSNSQPVYPLECKFIISDFTCMRYKNLIVYLSILLSPTWVVAGEQDNAAAMKEQK